MRLFILTTLTSISIFLFSFYSPALASFKEPPSKFKDYTEGILDNFNCDLKAELVAEAGDCPGCSCATNCRNVTFTLNIQGSTQLPQGWSANWILLSTNSCEITGNNLSKTYSINFGNSYVHQTVKVKVILLPPTGCQLVTLEKEFVLSACCQPIVNNLGSCDPPLNGFAGIPHLPFNCQYPNFAGIPPVVDGSCDAANDINPYLARAVDMKHMWRNVAPTTWSHPNNMGVNGNNEANLKKEIEMLVELKATLITRINQFWDQQITFIGQTPSGSWIYWDALEYIVREINFAFDCAGLKRPIIQAGIWETMHPYICRVAIPACVIGHFQDEINAAGLSSYYQPGISFNYKNILNDDAVAILEANGCCGTCVPGGGWSLPSNCIADAGSMHPDITKLETRMWWYYLAKGYIDRGITSIWLGQQIVMGENDEGYILTNQILEDIRDYAESQGKFVVIQGEGGTSNFVGGNGSTDLLFDYASKAIRPREIYVDDAGTPINVGALNDQFPFPNSDCGGAGGMYDPNMYANTPCAGIPTMAFVDKCHYYSNMGESPGGTAPNGCQSENAPVLLYLDSGPACYFGDTTPDYLPEGGKGEYYILLDKNNTSQNIKCPTPNEPQNCRVVPGISINSVWGWDDAAWFIDGFENSNECRATWLQMNIERVRGFNESGNVFMLIPGRIEGNDCLDNPNAFILADHPDLVDAIAKMWEPISIDENSISHSVICRETKPDNSCPGIGGCGNMLKQKGLAEHTFSVANPDLTSLYQIRIETLSGTVLSDFSYGPQKTIAFTSYPPLKVIFRQINFGITDPISGVVEVEKVFNNLNSECCLSENPIGTWGHVNVEIKQSPCWVYLEVPESIAGNFEIFHWEFAPQISPSNIINFTPNSSKIGVSLYGINTNYLAFCVGGVSEHGLLYSNQGTVSVNTSHCSKKDLQILVYPNPTTKTEKVTMWLSGDELQEFLKTAPHDIRVISGSNGTVVSTFPAHFDQTEINISNYNPGVYTVLTNYKGVSYSTNFVITE